MYSDDFQPEKHESSFLHEVVAGGAAFEAMKLYEDHQRKKGTASLATIAAHLGEKENRTLTR